MEQEAKEKAGLGEFGLEKSIICRSRASRDRAAVRVQERNAEGKEAGTGSEAHRGWRGGGEGGTQRSLMGWGRSPPVTGPLGGWEGPEASTDYCCC